jgi:hypothetical protein
MNTGLQKGNSQYLQYLAGTSPYSRVFRNTHWNLLYGLKMGLAFFQISGERVPQLSRASGKVLSILPFNSKRSRLPKPRVRGGMATPVGATDSKVRIARSSRHNPGETRF